MSHALAQQSDGHRLGVNDRSQGCAAAPLESQLTELRERLLRRARFAVRDHALAEDLVQDTLIAVVRRHMQRRVDAPLVTWATRILKNKVADHYRSPTVRRMVQMSAEDDELDSVEGSHIGLVAESQQPENLAEQQETVTALKRCVSAMPRQTGRVFVMHDWHGFETAEICDRLGVSAENSRTILCRARKTVRDCMQHDWIGCKGR